MRNGEYIPFVYRACSKQLGAVALASSVVREEILRGMYIVAMDVDNKASCQIINYA